MDLSSLSNDLPFARPPKTRAAWKALEESEIYKANKQALEDLRKAQEHRVNMTIEALSQGVHQAKRDADLQCEIKEAEYKRVNFLMVNSKEYMHLESLYNTS